MPGLSGHNRVNVRSFKAIEVRRCTDRVSAHVVEEKPVPHTQLRNPVVVNYFVRAVAGWTPDNRPVSPLAALNNLCRAQTLTYTMNITLVIIFYHNLFLSHV